MRLAEHIRNRREHRRSNTRQRILDAARKVFFELGFDACTVRDIIRASELAAGTFYNYFSTKEEVLRELVGEEIGGLSERVQESRRRANGPHAFVAGAFREVFAAVVAKPEIYRIMLRNESAVRDLFANSAATDSIGALRNDLRQAIDHGILPDMNTDWLAESLFGTAYALGRRLLEDSADAAQAEAAAEFAARLFLGGMQAFSDARPRSAFKLRLRAGTRKALKEAPQG